MVLQQPYQLQGERGVMVRHGFLHSPV